MSYLKIKVCGMRYGENIQELLTLNPDFIGFIFYPYSSRYVGNAWDPELTAAIPDSIQKTGVFVNAGTKTILAAAEKYHLNTIQLHGSETPSQCRETRQNGYHVIKAFAVGVDFDFSIAADYEGAVDYFLFDTKTHKHGGSGKKFNWRILERYKGGTPFLLSGGIGLEDVPVILQAEHPLMAGVDINSRFEDEPGLKNIEKVKEFIHQIRNS